MYTRVDCGFNGLRVTLYCKLALQIALMCLLSFYRRSQPLTCYMRRTPLRLREGR